MKILFLCPWFRTLAVGWADGLRRRGHDVRVVTTAQHFDPPAVSSGDRVFADTWHSRRGIGEAIAEGRDLAAWRPDVVVSDPVRDPRYTFLSTLGAHQIVVTHDARPHDDAHDQPLLRKINTAVLMRRSETEVVFSEHVRDARSRPGHRVEIVPLLSEMPEAQVPPFVAADERRDFLVIGRLSPYKNVPGIVRAYEEHRRSPDFRGDDLVIVGGGDPGCALPEGVRHVDGRFKFADVAPTLARAKASICFYSAGSQSGVQVWGMQCGTGSLVSDVGALGEYLPGGETPIPVGDEQELARRLAVLADPAEAERAGRRARAEYERRLTPDLVAARWEEVMASVIGNAGG